MKTKIFKILAIVFSLLLFVVALTILELYFIRLPSVDITTRMLLIGILTINVIALLTLIFFVGKSIFRLYMERHHKVLGYKFRTKLLTIFVILTLIPSASLFVAASGLATNYISRLFSAQMKEPFSKSIELARAFYDIERERVLKAARAEARKQDTRVRGLLDSELRFHRYTTLPADATDIIKEAFNGKEGTEVISGSHGDVIRAAVPDYSNVKGVVVAEIILPEVISNNSERLKEFYEEYLKLGSFEEPIKINFVLILGFFTMLIVFSGVWVSLKISQGIVVPIKGLAMATEEVAAGNLDVQVDIESSDEIGLLISSFNQMVKQIKEGKESIESAYAELDRRRLYLEKILESINSGVIFLDSSGRIVTANTAACSILNISKDSLLGKSYSDFISSLNSDELVNMVKDIEGKEIQNIRKEITIHIGGKNVILKIHIIGIRESDASKALGMLVVFDDLTDVIKAQKAAAWQEVARRLAHEIKNPLTPIKLSTERLIKKWRQKDTDFDAVFEKSTKTIISEVESLERLVDVFSRYGRMPEVNMVDTNIAEIIDSVSALFAGYKDVKINMRIDDNIPVVKIDKEQFKRVFINIIDNAISAMNEKGTIDISVRGKDDKVIVDIADTGPGIPDSEKERLFLPYFSRRKDGTGLGLAIADKIIRDHGGKISVRDNKPKGSIFSVEIPESK